MKRILIIAPIILLIGFTSCKKDKKDPDPTPVAPAAPTGSLKIRFEHVVDTLDFNLNQYYLNPKLDSFKVTKLKYYISNIVVTKNDNSTFAEANSYHIIDCADTNSTMLTIANVPVGSYKSVSFMIGVDSLHNCSGAQSGALAPSEMFWNWNTGYIMFMFEGKSPKSSATNKTLTYHIGGYGGVNKVQRNFGFSFASTTANVSTSATPQIHLSANVNELFANPNLIDVTTQNTTTMAGPMAKMYADNYADMISFEHVHNY